MSMLLDRLTDRAIGVLHDVPKLGHNKVKALDLIRLIKKSSGVGNELLKGQSVKLGIKRGCAIKIEDLVIDSFYHSNQLGHVYVGTEHLLLSVLKLAESVLYETTLRKIRNISIFPQESRIIDGRAETPLLSSFGINLTKELTFYSSDDPVYREELDSIFSTFLQQSNGNVLIVGEPGVGKRTMVDMLVKNIVNLDVPKRFIDTQVIEFDIMAFLAGNSNKSGFDLASGNLFLEFESLRKSIIYLKNFQNVFLSTNIGISIPIVYTMLKNFIESSTQVSVIATMPSSLYEKIMSENEHLIDGFSVLHLDEPDEEMTKTILRRKVAKFDSIHGVRVSDEVLDYLYTKARSKLKNYKFPEVGVTLIDSACTKLIVDKTYVSGAYKDLLDELSHLATKIREHALVGEYNKAVELREKFKIVDRKAAVKERAMEKQKKYELTTEYIDRALQDLNVLSVDEELLSPGKLKTLSDRLKKRIIGQEDSIDTVVRALIRSKMGLRDNKRPVGNFLFLGPTGVGKTELAKVLAELAFGEHGLIRLDMSDFGEKHTVARLVGAPPGYVGYGEGGELTSKIEARPESVVLFDEIEKAHPDVLNILLQIMEEGELSDARGNTFDFSRSVIVLTSNVGTEILHNSSIGLEQNDIPNSQVEKRLRNNLKKILKPELLNRFDEILVFSRLKEKEQFRVIEILINDVIANLAKQDINLKVSKDVKKHLLGLGYSEEYGARSLRRVIEKDLLDLLAEKMLDNTQRPLKLGAKMVDKKIVIFS